MDRRPPSSTTFIRRAALLKAQDDLREALHTQQTRVRNLRRLVLSRKALQETMPRRLQALVSSSRVADAAAREARFMEVSASYAEALAMDETRLREHAAPMVNSGLTWWVPTRGEEPGAPIRRLEQGWLPMHMILQTRELAVGTIMLYIGGNLGTTSIPRVVLGDFQYIYAAEPEPLNYACLLRTARQPAAIRRRLRAPWQPSNRSGDPM